MAKKAKRPAGSRKAKAKRKRHTPTHRRGIQFANAIRAIVAIDTRCNGKPFTKRMLADWLRDDFDQDMDDLSDLYLNAARACSSTSLAVPVGLRRIKDASRDRSAERAIKSLEKIGVRFTRTDEHGNELKSARIKRTARSKSTPAKRSGKTHSSAKVWWKYDPSSPGLLDLHKAFARYTRPTGYELEGIMNCAALLANFYGLPMEGSMRSLLARITRSVSKDSLEEASAHGLVWQWNFRRPRKYELQKKELQTWNDATILRRQCEIQYAALPTSWMKHRAPHMLGKLRKRTVAAFGTIFDPQEDSIYLVGSEPQKHPAGHWQPPVLYKLDRVVSIVMTEAPNPSLADMPGDTRISTVEGLPKYLDLKKLFLASFGPFVQYSSRKTGAITIRVDDPEQIALCYERPFHPRQRVIDFYEDETHPVLTLEIEQCYEDELIPRLLALKDGFEIVESEFPGLPKRIREVAEAIAKRHSLARFPESAGPAEPEV